MTSKKKRVLLIGTSMQPPGGANGVAAWMAHALQHVCELSVMMWEPLQVDAINDYYGTSLEARRIREWAPPRVLRSVVNALPLHSLPTLQLSLMLWWKRVRRQSWDVVVSTHNELDVGCHGIQYVHFPRPADDAVHLPHFFRHHAVGRAIICAYRVFCEKIAGWRHSRMLANVTLVNSHFTADVYEKYYATRPRVLYPPAAGHPRAVAWEGRGDGFLCVGRLSPFKRFEAAIDILDRVRARGFDVQLHIVGGPEPQSTAYFEFLTRKARLPWIHMHGVLSRDELMALTASHRYGLHMTQEEHFGMAVAEMVRGGCIVFVPDGGGQVEVVADSRLIYGDDVVEKICAVLASPSLQADILAGMRDRGDPWSAERFCDEIVQVVDAFEC